MKRCPQCDQYFNNEDVFCLNDGSVLETAGPSANDTPTQVLAAPFTGAVEKTAGGSRFYWIIGSMALVIVFLLGGMFVLLLRPVPPPAIETAGNKPGSSQTPAPGSKPENETLAATNSAAALTQPGQPSLPPVTAEAARSLIERWEKAQDARNFSLYQQCYGQPFFGVKRTRTGEVSQMNYGQWMNDRRKMLSKAAGLDVGIEGLQITIAGDTATAEFEQYYRSASYRDRGPKVLKIKMFPEGAKIVYEEIKASNPL
jgi:hypothetical protein